ncbi:hypothetical protein I4U23_012079 [Adineta vaga]|nr:hypothetical protein I4U23_012079 [Adineta vaga]
MATVFEDLPDELLLIICQFLNQYYIIHGFLNLNYRLNCTISQFCNLLMLQNNSQDQQEQSRELLSVIGSKLQSLTIKNTRLSTEQVSLASNIRELTLIQTQLKPFPLLPHLTDLNIFTISTIEYSDVLFIDNVNLHSVFISSTSPLTNFSSSEQKKSTIKQLAVSLRSIKDFQRLLNICPELTCLNLNLQIAHFPDAEPIETSSSNLRIFSLRTLFDISISFDRIQNILEYLPPTLEHLGIEIFTLDLLCANGEHWENYLKEKFPNLTQMEFFIYLRRDDQLNTTHPRLSEVLKTFKSSYWSNIIAHQINGDYQQTRQNTAFSIFTEPAPTVRRRRYFLH